MPLTQRETNYGTVYGVDGSGPFTLLATQSRGSLPCAVLSLSRRTSGATHPRSL